MKKFKMVEAPLNLVSMQQGWLICFPIASDYDCSVGLPKLMNDTYNLATKVDETELGKAIFTDNVCSLIVKESSYDKADITELENALIDMRDKCIEKHIDKIAMPKLCTGRNGLKWKDVKTLIKEVFADTKIFILVCAI